MNGFRVLEDAAKNDIELRNVLGDTIGKPEQMRQKVIITVSVFISAILHLFKRRTKSTNMIVQVEDRIRKKGRDFHKAKTGSVVAFKVTFRE